MNQATAKQLILHLNNTRQRTLELVNGLNAKQMMGEKLTTVNPLLWEIGHVAYFYELWILRHLDGVNSILENADALYDSIHIAHTDRWDLPLLSRADTLAYMQQVLDKVVEKLQQPDVSDEAIYLTRYAIFHEDMHTEAFTYTRQTLNYPTPQFSLTTPLENSYLDIETTTADINKALDYDALIPARSFVLGADKKTEFCFDNEKWGHSIHLDTFQIAKTATTYAQYAAFVDAGGYQNSNYWDKEGWEWLQKSKLQCPLYWQKDGNTWLIKHFDQWQIMQPNAAVIHISWHEAMAWCRWAGRRLPSEAEWELAAAGNPNNAEKTRYPWGNSAATPQRANLDGYRLQTIDVYALPEGDSAFACRQMLGNVWEWTVDTFEPYPEFKADMYADYSQPLFYQTKVLKGGAWTSRSRMLRNTWRNYYGADRNDVFAGFRSCAL